jgi:hypothetical protein
MNAVAHPHEISIYFVLRNNIPLFDKRLNELLGRLSADNFRALRKFKGKATLIKNTRLPFTAQAAARQKGQSSHCAPRQKDKTAEKQRP